ncbi:uncharacterized protein N7506_001728 [Penicillium brevicompactum]|uniref:uncharacterized protein n=1 Tax=Penicillium brevicompactum TaxID=5074 RepID=UPI002540D441|nr:uncharacterized protein N7506_001728 [Penicillium brevicompactum]KAJ5348475.1 hypothetical protein N7506_001728 [Penicillium brevicompactum]
MASPLQQSSKICRHISSRALRVSGKSPRSFPFAGGRQSRSVQQLSNRSDLIASISLSTIRMGAASQSTTKHPQRGHTSSGHLSTDRTSYSTTAISNEPVIHDVFDDVSGTWQYIVADPTTLTAVIIDPVLNFDPATQAITTRSADSLLALVKARNYKIDKILETHAHADHLSAASYLQTHIMKSQDHKPPICIGKRIEAVQKLFSQRYGVPSREYRHVFDKLFDDDETFAIGNMTAKAIHLPGHTPDHLGYMIGDNIFCGDSLFHADIGTARCDFPGGDAKDLFQSGRKLLDLPGHFKIWTGHDYPPEGRTEPVPWLSVREHRELNKHLKDGMSEEHFVALRKERDEKLAAPRLLHQSLQINIRAGRLPAPTEAGHRLLHVPLKIAGEGW